MRKIILFLTVGFFAISCSSDDSNSDTGFDFGVNALVGTWKPISSIEENTDTHENTNTFEVCNDKTRITYNSNNTASAIVYHGSNVNSCSSSNINNVSWSLDGSNLKLNYPGIGEMYSVITFSNQGTVMTDVTIDGNYKITTVYTKVF